MLYEIQETDPKLGSVADTVSKLKYRSVERPWGNVDGLNEAVVTEQISLALLPMERWMGASRVEPWNAVGEVQMGKKKGKEGKA